MLHVMEQELSVFDRGERPDYEVFGAIVDFFKKYPDSLSSCTLQPEDWADIALKIADRYGPPADADFEEQFSTLRRNILEQAAAEVDIMAR